MQARRQDCRISSKPLVVLSQNTGSFRSVKGRGSAVYRFRICVRTIPCAPAGACLCFSVEVLLDVKFWQGRPQPLVDVAAHGAEPDVRHVQDRVFHLAPHFLDRVQIRAAGRQKLQLHASRRPISSLTNFDLCCGAPSVIIRIFRTFRMRPSGTRQTPFR